MVRVPPQIQSTSISFYPLKQSTQIRERQGEGKFTEFAEKLDELRKRMEESFITSIDFLKQLLQLDREVLEEEKKVEQPDDSHAKARAALTDLFQSIKTEETPIIVEQVVNDIDNEVVNTIPVQGCLQECDSSPRNQEKAPLNSLD